MFAYCLPAVARIVGYRTLAKEQLLLMGEQAIEEFVLPELIVAFGTLGRDTPLPISNTVNQLGVWRLLAEIWQTSKLACLRGLSKEVSRWHWAKNRFGWRSTSTNT